MNPVLTAFGPVSLGPIALGFAAGATIGASYFLGLWWTVRRATRSARPTPLLLASFVVRLALAVAVLLVIVRLGALALVAALLGFLAARVLLTRTLGVGTDVADEPDVPTGRGANERKGSR
ncbi:MAG: ATP synthase subunit I [Trueperaceae bacterium]